ncbi:lysostaphin resistance A-like protein [Streptococcus hyovaginalis]
MADMVFLKSWQKGLFDSLIFLGFFIFYDRGIGLVSLMAYNGSYYDDHYFLLQTLLLISLSSMILFYLKRRYGLRLWQVKPLSSRVAFAVALGLIWNALVIFTEGLLPLSANGQAWANLLINSTGVYYDELILLHMLILGPLIEELLFRGCLMALMDKCPLIMKLSVSALLFSLMHTYAYPFSLIHVAYFFLSGLGFAVTYTYSKTLIVPIICHILFNTYLSLDFVVEVLRVYM